MDMKMSRKQRQRRKNRQPNAERQFNILTKPEALHDPHIQVLMEKVRLSKTNSEMMEAILQLQKFVDGESSVLADPDKVTALNKLRSEAAGRDVAEEAWNRDKEAFINETLAKGDKVKLTGEKADQAKAKAGHLLKEARQNASALQRSKQLQLDWELQHGQKRQIHVSGTWEHVRQGEVSQPVLRPDVIRIMHRTFVLQPGVQLVPERVAQEYDRLLRGRLENQRREQVLSAPGDRDGLSAEQLELENRRIDQEFNTKRDSLAVAG